MPGAIPQQPKWFTPARLLCIFCIVNLFVYLDRGLIASNGVNGSPVTEQNPEGSGIQGEFKLSRFQDGLLPAAFMVGLLISSPIFAETCKQFSAFRLLGIGMGIWSLACIGCGIAPNFTVMLLSRACVGVGEASFVAMAAPFIDDYAPTRTKTQWFAMFYLCIPVGFALGYIFGGVVAASMGWRWSFIIEAIAMAPFVIFACTAQPLQLHGTQSELPGGEAATKGSHQAKPLSHYMASFWADVRLVMGQPVWLMVCAAYTLYVAVLGVYAYWGPQAGFELFFGNEEDSQAASERADLTFGGVTVLTGVIGSLAGGIALDRLGSTLRNANLLCAISCLVGFVVQLLAFTTTHSFASFMTVFAVGQLFIFLLQAPVAAITMWCVPTTVRPLGASLMTVAIHLFGDVPSPPLLGRFKDWLSQGKEGQEAAETWRAAMSAISVLLVGSGLFFVRAAYLSVPGSDFRPRAVMPAADEEDDPEAITSDQSPLLAEHETSSNHASQEALAQDPSQ